MLNRDSAILTRDLVLTRFPDVERHNGAVILLFLKESLKTVNISFRASAVEA